MKPLLSWPQRLIAAPLFGAIIGYGCYVVSRLLPDAEGPASASECIGLSIGVTVGALMFLWLVSFVRFERPGEGAHRR